MHANVWSLRGKEMFYGWRVVGGGFLSQAFVIGFFTYAVSLLTQPVQESFDVSVEMVMYSLTFGTFIGLFAMPIAVCEKNFRGRHFALCTRPVAIGPDDYDWSIYCGLRYHHGPGQRTGRLHDFLGCGVQVVCREQGQGTRDCRNGHVGGWRPDPRL